jgi:hypothetical protein
MNIYSVLGTVLVFKYTMVTITAILSHMKRSVETWEGWLKL